MQVYMCTHAFLVPTDDSRRHWNLIYRLLWAAWHGCWDWLSPLSHLSNPTFKNSSVYECLGNYRILQFSATPVSQEKKLTLRVERPKVLNPGLRRSWVVSASYDPVFLALVSTNLCTLVPGVYWTKCFLLLPPKMSSIRFNCDSLLPETLGCSLRTNNSSLLLTNWIWSLKHWLTVFVCLFGDRFSCTM